MRADGDDNQHFLAGVRAGVPIAIGYVPIAIAYGALSVASGLSWWTTTLMSALVFAGAAQFMAIGMLATGAGALQIIVATFILNFRHLIMSLSLSDRLRHFPLTRRIAAGLGTTDETFAVLAVRCGPAQPRATPRFVAGLMLAAYLSWVLGSAFGAAFAAVIPTDISSGMTVALYAMFIALLVPSARGSARVTVTAVTGMALCYVFGHVMAHGWAIVCATLIGAFVGLAGRPGGRRPAS